MSGKIDLHIHTTASDGTDTPEQLLEKLLQQGIHTFAITDHDSLEGSLDMQRLVPPGMRMIRGIEFSCIAPRGKCHILGYDFDLMDDDFWDVFSLGRQCRIRNLTFRKMYLGMTFGIFLTEAEEMWLMSQAAPGKPHLAKILVERGLAENVDDAIRQYINPAGGCDERIPAEQAVKAIAHAGGIPVWAHPLGGEGERRISREEFAARLADLMEYGIQGLECCYSRYGEEDVAFLLDQAKIHGLLVSGGSDYHGDNKVGIALGKLNEADTPVDAATLTILGNRMVV